MKNVIITFGIVVFSTTLFAKETIKINLSGLSNNTGQIIVMLFKKGQDFGMNKTPFKRFLIDKITNKMASLFIKELDLGEYSLLIFHDEDGDGKLTKNWIGMPLEGIGKSGIQKTKPTYENSNFTLSGGVKTFTLKLNYL